MTESAHDVIIVGAGIAGAAAAILFAREGYSVLLLERARDNTHYKKICTHFIQPSAVPVLRRLGVEEQLLAAGALKNSIAVWSPHGWTLPAAAGQGGRTGPTYGYNVTREVLDPLVRGVAAQTPGVEVSYGCTVSGLLFNGEQVIGVEGVDGANQPFRRLAHLTVVADGRNSRLPGSAGLAERQYVNERFVYYAYFKGIKLRSGGRSQFWFFGERSLFAYPLANGVTLLCVFEDKRKLELWRGNVEERFLRAFEDIAAAPDLSESTRISDYLGMLDLNGYIRTAAGKGVAVIGDAALAIDPMAGVGCGWALQAAGWLVDAASRGLRNPAMLNVQLRKYAEQHSRSLAPHARFIFDAARCRPHNLVENLFFRGATRDQRVSERLNDFIARNISASEFLSVGNVARTLYAALLKGRPPEAPAGEAAESPPERVGG